MKLFSHLLKRKTELEHEVALRRSLLLNAERALVLAGKLEEELPGLIENIRTLECDVVIPANRSIEDFSTRRELASHAIAVQGAERLIKDLPKIRTHWEGVRSEFAA